jgi:glyoxylate/hydroxypyruvate reductase A
VRCGRGPQVHVPDLIAALDSGQLSHAWLDIFAIEPLPSDDPLWTHPAVTVTPHIASSSSPDLLAADIAENVRRSEAMGNSRVCSEVRVPHTSVNPESL